MINQKIIIRADGNARIGAGHLMRCLTIADALVEKEQVTFVCAEEDSAILVREKGYVAWTLHTDHTCMEAELPEWEHLFPVPEERVILVDSYFMTDQYLKELRRFGKVIILDDMAERIWTADAVINYNAFADPEIYLALGYSDKQEPKCFIGGKYIPIRQEFCGRDYVVQKVVKNVLITTGGGDCENIAGQILEHIRTDHCHYHVVTGRFNPNYDALLKIAEQNDNIHIYHNVSNMAELMEQCDLAVTAGGTTIYELSAVGVPFVCFSYAENQEKLTEYIGAQQIAGYAGAFHKIPVQTLAAIREQIHRLENDGELRRQYSVSEKKLVDGQGAFRIAAVIRGQFSE